MRRCSYVGRWDFQTDWLYLWVWL